jgi:RND family efflux transporter MFP subunit
MMPKRLSAIGLTAVIAACFVGAKLTAVPTPVTATPPAAVIPPVAQNHETPISTPAPVQAAVPAQTSFEAHTDPSRRAKVMFVAPGVVADVAVKDGQAVKQGQVLARLDDRGEKSYLDSLQLEATSTHKVDAAKADLEAKRVELKRKEDLFANHAASQSELDEATVNVKIREIQVGLEEMTREQKRLEADKQAVKVQQMTLVAPFDGIVEKIDFEVGEIPDQQKAISIVKNDALWVDVYMPTGVALRLRDGDELPVKYKDTGEETKGKVILLSPVADAASETRLVRIEVPNPAGLPSGLAVSVTVDPVAAR